MTFLRSSLRKFVAPVIAATIVSSVACAQTDNPLHLTLPCAAGSPADTFARAVAQMLTEELGRQVFVKNLLTPDPIAQNKTIKASQADNLNTPSEAPLVCGE